MFFTIPYIIMSNSIKINGKESVRVVYFFAPKALFYSADEENPPTTTTTTKTVDIGQSIIILSKATNNYSCKIQPKNH